MEMSGITLPHGIVAGTGKKIISLKDMMKHLYQNGKHVLTTKGEYSVSRSYLTLLGNPTKMSVANLVWSAIMLPKQRVILWLAYQERLLTKERL